MNQLRLVWNCNASPSLLHATKKRHAKCGLSLTPSGESLSLLRKFERLQQERPVAAAVIERLVDQALANRKVPP